LRLPAGAIDLLNVLCAGSAGAAAAGVVPVLSQAFQLFDMSSLASERRACKRRVATDEWPAAFQEAPTNHQTTARPASPFRPKSPQRQVSSPADDDLREKAEDAAAAESEVPELTSPEAVTEAVARAEARLKVSAFA
jgi:hypothetical protein